MYVCEQIRENVLLIAYLHYKMCGLQCEGGGARRSKNFGGCKLLYAQYLGILLRGAHILRNKSRETMRREEKREYWEGREDALNCISLD